MTRIRKPLDITDSGFNPANRPPINLLDQAWAKPLAEFDDVTTRISYAESSLRELSNPESWALAVRAAQEADALASGEAARAGTIEDVTEHIDALHHRKRHLEATVGALTVARQLIYSDLVDIRTAAKQNHDTRDEDAARKNLAAALAKAHTAAETLASAIAAREWTLEHLPWDPSVNLNILDIWAPIHSMNEPHAVKIPVPLTAVITALTNL